ncbi:MAG TPA: hypothetical protein VHW65_09190, partial [Gemmatimonadales bacterium]|nr:hypothetical protein [Gemmatimonadales bacterium]
SNQNGSLLDGMNFDGSALPPDAMCSLSIATTTADPSRGAFAGGQRSATSCGGGEYAQSTVRGSLLSPALTWSDPASPNRPATVATISGFAGGPLQHGVAHYRFSFSASDRATDATTLLSARSPLLQQLGLVQDTVAVVVGALTALHLPVTAASVPDDIERRSGVAFLNMEWNPGSSTSLLLTATGAVANNAGVGLGASSVPSTAGSATQRSGRVMLRGSTYLHGIVDEVTAVVSASSTDAEPYVATAHGTVLVGTDYAGGTTSLASLGFGGGPVGAYRQSTEWNTRNQLEWSRGGSVHQLTFGQQLIVSANRAVQAADTLGSFVYPSLAALAANAPSAFTRTLGAPANRGHQNAEALWLSDIWRKTSAITFQGGLRLDAEQSGDRPPENTAVDSLFGRRTDRIPAQLFLSPRVGFAWLLKRTSGFINHPGLPRDVRFTDGTDPLGLDRANDGPGVTLSGSIGAYRGTVPDGLLAELRANTGLAGAARTVSCVGAAAPVPDWSTPQGSLFDRCANGEPAATFAATQSAVTVMDRGYRAPVDWRSNVAVTGVVWRGWSLAPSLVLDRAEDVESAIDLNLQRTPSFALASEANRPVYAPVGDVVPATGAIASDGGRILPQYSAVTSVTSDLHRDAVQFNVDIARAGVSAPFRLGLTYSFNWQRSETRGFQGTTAGDPSTVETAAGAQPVHQVVLTTPGVRLWWFAAALRVNVTSGVAYTPVVVGDINGDGVSNDRAFVPAAGVAADTALRSQLARLLAAAPATAQNCLRDQEGRIAEINSCRGPWQAQLDLTLNFAPPQGIGLGDRLHVTTRLFNAGAAMLRLLGASGSVTQGSLPPDGRLLYVTGFDPATSEFRYRVNQAFGQPFDFGVGSHQFPPFAVQIEAEYKLGMVPPNPYLHRLGLETKGDKPLALARIRAAMERGA